ncbi:PREDICTED: uncharacterized protein LOC106108862 [Papilio polytes]|uniref:uncharacterized protein LOC106108862 n=1 Tax=Papilio polytes TaxID=76194 RepID=UPI000675E889|nr:PREDICTED: uncharacterized protein LOC106108862 [Papilio polytes]
MSVSVDDVSSPLSEGQSTVCDEPTSSSDNQGEKNDGVEAGQEKSEPTSPKPHPMAFTVDFGESKRFDNRRLEELAKKSQARHQRVQSMSAGTTRQSPTIQRPPMSVKLPRKAQGYNSEGYFSSDQEDSGVSNSVKLKSSPLAQNVDKTFVTSPITNRHIKSPITDSLQPKKQSKSPIVDSIMSRSENFSSRQNLILPLSASNSNSTVIHKTPSYSNLSYHKHVMANIIDQSPEGIMITDISSPELDILTPDNGLSTPEPSRSPTIKVRAMSETPDLLFNKCPPKPHALFIDDEMDRQSNNSSTGTYTIEADNYTEEQKARMSIDRSFGADLLKEAIDNSINKRNIERDPEIVFDFPNPQRVITKEPRREVGLRSPVTHTAFDIPNKVSKDKNVLEISCCYESPNENDLAVQTSKQIKSTRSYLEKIKNRVRTITEKTFPKPKVIEDQDIGSFTSVTTSGVLSMKNSIKIDTPVRRRCSLTKSEIDKTDYIHRLSRESSVPVSLPSKGVPFEGTFESSALKNAQKALQDDSGISSDITPDQMVGRLSYMSLNRCKGDKTWIQDWAESVKNYNNNTLAKDADLIISYPDSAPLSPRCLPGKPRSPHGSTPTKIPSPVGTLLHRRTPDLIPPQDTESYLLKTQNAITNLQAKLQSSRTNNFSNIPSQLTSSLISEKTAVSRVPLSQLSRSNSLNYRLRRKDNSNDSSPLRSPGHYVITGSNKTNTKVLLNTASRSLDTDRRHDSNMNSPSSDRGLCSNSSEDKTISNKPQYKTSPRYRQKIEVKPITEAVCLKAVLKNNAIDSKLYPRIDQTRYQGDAKKSHQRVYSDSKQYKPVQNAFGVSIRRSSSFNTVNRNNNHVDARIKSRRSSGHSEDYKDYCISDESDTGSFDKSQDVRFKRTHRGRIDSPDLKSTVPTNSPRCPNTPEMQRKFGPGLIRNAGRPKDRSRMSEPPVSKEERTKPVNHQSRRISDPTRQAVLSRLTKSRSSTRELQPKVQEKVQKKASQYRSSSALATKEVEFSNWKKRSSYDPMKAAQEGKKRQQKPRQQECNKDDLSSPSHSSPVHRSQSFHTTNIADLETLDYSSEDDQMATLPIDPMITSTHSDILDLRTKDFTRENLRRQAMTNDVVLSRNYVTSFQVNQPSEKKRKDADKRKTYIVDDITPTKENVDFLQKRDNGSAVDKRKTFILDSDTNSTTNGSSPRNSSIFSHEKNSLTTGTSDTEGESGTESAPVVMRHQGGKKGTAQAKQRYSGDYSMSSSTTSISQQKRPKDIQPRYLDISKYKNDNSPKNFLRRDPSKTYVNVLPHHDRPSRGSAQQYEMEQKKQELEKWKRRASYDPRKAAALGKTGKAPPKTASSVLRSQSFHGQVLVSPSVRYQPPPTDIVESYDASSDNDF